MLPEALVRGLAALVLAAGVASAQEGGSPSDLLAHVKVGQVYTFQWTAGTDTHEEVWHVAEVEPERVRFMKTTRMRHGGQVKLEHTESELQEWRWGGQPVLDPAALAMAKMTQSRKKLEVPGAKLDCIVTLLDDNLETWTAVKGDLETFPGAVKVKTKDGLLRTLAKVEAKGPPTLPARAPQEAVEAGSGLPKGALDHVRVGQRWRFEIDNEDMRSRMTWTVTEVHASEGRVVYRMKGEAHVDGQWVGTDEDEGLEWTAGGSPVLDPGTRIEGMSGERKVLDVPGAKLDCYALTITLGEGSTEVWTAVRGDHEVFPGPVKQVMGRMTQRLVRVEQP
jgi:hypothetical protein